MGTTSGVVKAWVASGVTTVVVYGIGVFGLVMLMLILNGFSGRTVTPLFVVYLAGISGANAGSVARVSSFVLRGVPDPALRRRACAWNAIAFTALPWLLFAASLFRPR